MAIGRATIRRLGTVVAVGALLGGGADDFLNDINGIGIGARDDPHNFDLVGLGNAICWRLYTGDTPGHVADDLVTKSQSDSRAPLSPGQATAEVGFALTDLCPDAAPN